MPPLHVTPNLLNSRNDKLGKKLKEIVNFTLNSSKVKFI